MVQVEWSKVIPDVGSHLVIEVGDDLRDATVFTLDMQKLGILRTALRRPRRDIVSAQVGDEARNSQD